ncbi:MAG: Hsp33 family molecular chaperone HslO [Ruthenibacterium sp.]
MANCIRAISEDGGFLFCGVDATEMVREMERIHKTSAVTSAALGRLLIAAGIMGVMLKSERNSVTLRVNGGGPAGTVLAVANGKGEVKGYITHPIVELPARADGKLNVGAAVGCDGTLSVAKDLGMKEPYVGQVPLISGEIAEDVTSYYAASEQTPTVCGLGVLVNTDLSILSAGGYLLQAMPGTSEEDIARLEQNVAQMQSVTQMLQDKKTPRDMMEIALAGFSPQILNEQMICYHCDCSRSRVEKMMISLGKKELERLLTEENTAEAVCHFCDKKYTIDLQSILNGMQTKK